MTRKRGRPAFPGLGVWRNPEILSRRVTTICQGRDVHDEETLTETRFKLVALATRILRHRPLTAAQRARLVRLSLDAKPSVITRTLISWRSGLPHRTVRRVQREQADILDSRWG